MKPFRHLTTARLHQLLERRGGWIAAAVLALMFGLSFGAMLGDSAIMDEVAHIPSAYSYLAFGDYRLNPEHPPLLKDLAAAPLMLLDLRFPLAAAAWTTAVNGQWDAGWEFLYGSGNNPQHILFWSRLPILLLAVGFGVVIYRFVRRRFGAGTALLALTFYALFPSFLAHNHYVTTDLGASLFMFLALAAFIRYLERCDRLSVVILGVALAGAQLAKFSSVLLYPFMMLVCAAVVLRHAPTSVREALRRFWRLFAPVIAASALSIGIVWAFYAPHTMRMPDAVQDRLISGSLYHESQRSLVTFLSRANDIAPLRPLVQYVLGVGMVTNRVGDGNVTYFNGEVSNRSFVWYFPELLLLKTPIPLIIIGLVVGGAAAAAAVRRFRPQSRPRLRRVWSSLRIAFGQLRERPATSTALWVLGGYSALYFYVSVSGNLNLGVRHILPMFVPMFIVIAVASIKLLGRLVRRTHGRWYAAGFVALIVWYVIGSVAAYPGYVAYFNGLIGGSANASRYFSDSSVDWGQDLLRLRQYVERHPEMGQIGLDYFGGGLPEYYFCKPGYGSDGTAVTMPDEYDCAGTRFRHWSSQFGRYPGQYLAISETYLENDRYYAALENRDGYAYLRAREPYARIGNSIYIYKLY